MIANRGIRSCEFDEDNREAQMRNDALLNTLKVSKVNEKIICFSRQAKR